MPDEDTKKDDAKITGQDPVVDPKVGDDSSVVTPKKRRRRPRKKRTVQPKDAQTVVPDLAMVHDEASEELDRPRDENEEFVDHPKEPEQEPIVSPEPFVEPAPVIPDMAAPVEPESSPTPFSSEPSPFDLAASFDNSAGTYADSAPSVPEQPSSPFSNEPVTPFSAEPASPFDLSPPPTTPVYEPPNPEPISPEPSPFDLNPSTEKPVAESVSEPMVSPVNNEPSPFDLAPSMVHEDQADSFGDYQSPFGGPPNSESTPTSVPEPIFEKETPPVTEPEAVFDSNQEPYTPSPFDMASDSESDKKEVFEGEVVAEEAPTAETVEAAEGSLEELAMEGSIMDKVEQLLHEANLTPRHLKFCCGSLVLVGVVILGGFFLAPKLINSDFSFFNSNDSDSEVVSDDVESDNEVIPDVVTPPVEVTPVEPIPAPNGQVWVDPSIYGGLLLGNPRADIEGTTGVDTGVLVGDDEKKEYSTKFQTFVADLEAVYNLYFVDVEILLDESLNRTKTLDEHIKQLKEYYNLGVDHFEELAVMQAELSAEFDENAILKNEAEVQVFEDLNEFKGPESEEQLYIFIELKQVEADLKARYYVLKKLESMYETVLKSVFTRIKDYELNREALIADVQVVDVAGSDIDLILTEFDLEE